MFTKLKKNNKVVVAYGDYKFFVTTVTSTNKRKHTITAMGDIFDSNSGQRITYDDDPSDCCHLMLYTPEVMEMLDRKQYIKDTKLRLIRLKKKLNRLMHF